jgi:hypothetical protein
MIWILEGMAEGSFCMFYGWDMFSGLEKLFR